MIAANPSCRYHDVVAVLSSLDAATRNELLACFQADEREQLLAILNSADVSDSAQSDALVVELLHSLRWKAQQLDVSRSNGLDLESWGVSDSAAGVTTTATVEPAAEPADPIEQALANIPVRRLFELLEPQHPQLIAATLKLMHPHQVQSVLPFFPNPMQLEIADRMDRCEDFHADIAMELRCELMNYFTATTEHTSHRTTIPLDRRRYE